MINFEAWKRMSPVRRELYEDNARRSKKIVSATVVFIALVTAGVAFFAYLLRGGAL